MDEKLITNLFGEVIPKKENNRILLLCDNFLPSTGGAELFMHELGKRLKAHGYDVEYAVRWLPDRNFDEIDGMKIHQYKITDDRSDQNNINELANFIRFLQNNRYKAIIANSQPDNWIGLAINKYPDGFNNLIFLPIINKGLIDFWEESGLTTIVCDTLKKADFLIVPNESGYEQHFLKINNLQHINIPRATGLDILEFDLRKQLSLKNKHLLLCVADFEPYTKVLNIIKFFVMHPIKDIDLVVIGKKTKKYQIYYEHCKRIASEADFVHFVSDFKIEQINSAVSQSDLILIPTIVNNGDSQLIVKAMHYGVPWIATPDYHSAFDNVGGVVADLIEFPFLSKLLLENKEIMNKMSDLGKKRWNNDFNWEKQINAYIDLIERNPQSRDFRLSEEFRIQHKEILHQIKQIQENEINSEYPEKTFQYDISVIIPTYNRADVLKMCLDSLNNQSFDHNRFEVIVIDDGSTDHTKDIVKEYPNKFNLKYLKQNNAGPGAARNKGLQIAKGKYSLILNDDALLDPENLKIHYETHQKLHHKKVAVIGTFNYAKEFLDKPFVWLAENTFLVFAYNTLQKHRIHNYRYFWTCNISILTEAIRKAGYFDEVFNEPMMEDTELGYRLEKQGFGVYFEPAAKSIHYHWIDVPGFIKRQEMSGRNIIKYFGKYPFLMNIEIDVFDLTIEELNEDLIIQKKLATIEPQVKLLKNYLTDIDKIKILSETKYEIFFEENKPMNRVELLNSLMYAGYILHSYYFYSGVVQQLKKQNFQLTYVPQLIEPVANVLESFEKPIKAENYPGLKLLMTTYGWNQDGGGTELPKSIALALSKRNIDIVVVVAEQNHPSINKSYYVEEVNENKVKLYKIYNRPTAFLDATNPRREILDQEIFDIFSKIVEKEKPDLVHFHNFLGLSFAISEIPKQNKIPSLFTAHNFHLIDPELYMFDFNQTLAKWENTDLLSQSILVKSRPDLEIDYKIRKEVARKLLNDNIDVFIAIYQCFSIIYNEFAGVYSKTVVLNQISEICDKIKPIQKDFVGKLRVGFLGSMYPHKGVHNIYRAADILSNYNIEFYLYGLGKIDYIKVLEETFPNAKVKYMGKYSPNDLQEIGKNLDCIVISSIWEEGGPLVAPEALAMGLPIVGANIGGIPDFVIDGLNGKLYNYNDPTDLARAIKYLYQNPDELKRMQVNSYLPYNFNDYVENLINLYLDLKNNKNNCKPKNYQLIFSSKLVNRAGEFVDSLDNNKIFNDEDLLELIDRELTKEIKSIENPDNKKFADLFHPIMLHLASQGEIFPGFINIDQNPQNEGEIKGDIRKLEFEDNSVELIVAKNILQVFSHRELPKILLEWRRVLKPAGSLVLSVPDIKSILEAYNEGKLDFDETNTAIFGNQTNEFDYFYNSFDEKSIVKILETLGFKIIEVQKTNLNSQKYFNLFVRCIKT